MSNSTMTADGAAAAAAAAAFEQVLKETLGSILISTHLMAIFYGITLLQTWHYFRSFPQDRIALKLFVVFLTLLDTACTVLLIHAVWTYCIIGWGRVDVLDKLLVTEIINVEVTAVLQLAVQMYLISRVWMLSRGNIYIAVVLTLLAIASLVSSIVYGVQETSIPRFSMLSSIQNTCVASISTAVATDLFTSICLIHYFRRSRTAFSKTNSVLDLLINYALGTGLVQTACAVANLITFRASPSTDVWTVFFVLIPKFYVNSCLVTLNMRTLIRNNDKVIENTDKMPLSKLKFNNAARSSPTQASRGTDTYIMPTIENGVGDASKAELTSYDSKDVV